MLIPTGSDLVFQLHYTTNGKATTDVTRIGFVYAKSTPQKRVIRVQASNAGFVIPPGAQDYPLQARLPWASIANCSMSIRICICAGSRWC